MVVIKRILIQIKKMEKRNQDVIKTCSQYLIRKGLFMKNGVTIIAVIAVLAVSGLALSRMMGIGGSCCSTHHVHHN